MSSAETTHAVEWLPNPLFPDEEVAYRNGEEVGIIWPSGMFELMWSAQVGPGEPDPNYVGAFPTARSFVEKSVKEAGHGE